MGLKHDACFKRQYHWVWSFTGVIVCPLATELWLSGYKSQTGTGPAGIGCWFDSCLLGGFRRVGEAGGCGFYWPTILPLLNL
jgi:hypothetical protein